jgi:hypothetical protein
MDMTSVSGPTDLVPAADVEIVVARLGAELPELERQLAAATQVATGSELRARAAGTDLTSAAWTMVRFRRFLEAMVEETDRENAELIELAHRQAHRMLSTGDVRPVGAPGIGAPAIEAPGRNPGLLPAPPMPLGPVEEVTPESLPPAATNAAGTALEIADPSDVLVGERRLPADDGVWDVLDGPAGRDPNEPFWPDATRPDVSASRRGFSVNALLRLGSLACVAGAYFLFFA